MNIALVGYGKMGKEIEQQALARGHTISQIIDADGNIADISTENTDVAIEFTQPDSCLANVEALAHAGVNIVVGTTGWYDEMDRMTSIVNDACIGLLWASNFSIGVNAFWKIVESSGHVFNQLPEYDVSVHEVHHTQKKDSPSGTAISTAEILLQSIHRKHDMITDRFDRAPAESELHVSSTRTGSVPGTHTVTFDSAADSIEIRHTARNRSGFALGAVMTAEWLQGKTGIYTMADYISDLLS